MLCSNKVKSSSTFSKYNLPYLDGKMIEFGQFLYQNKFELNSLFFLVNQLLLATLRDVLVPKFEIWPRIYARKKCIFLASSSIENSQIFNNHKGTNYQAIVYKQI